MCRHLGRRLPTPQQDSNTAPFCLCFSHFCLCKPALHSSFLCLMVCVLARLLIERSGPLWHLLPRGTASHLMSTSFHSIAPCKLLAGPLTGWPWSTTSDPAICGHGRLVFLSGVFAPPHRDVAGPCLCSALWTGLYPENMVILPTSTKGLNWNPDDSQTKWINSSISWANFYICKFLGATYL